MAVSSTFALGLGTTAPAFALPDVVSGDTVTLDDFDGADALLVMFICRHCPYVKHVQAELVRIARQYQPRLGIVAISSNDAERYPEDAPERLKEMAESAGFTFPLLYDETQSVAKAYHAACTPDFFLFDGDYRLVYRGQLDDSRPRTDTPVTGRDLRAAIEATLNGRASEVEQKPSVGCGIKWKPGNEPF